MKVAFKSLKVLMVGIIVVIEMSMIRSLEEVLDDWQKKKKLANSSLSNFNAI